MVSVNSFESAYARWMGEHLSQREGERKRRLPRRTWTCGEGDAQANLVADVWKLSVFAPGI